MSDFYRVYVFSFWNIITSFIENKKINNNSTVVSIGSTAILREVNYLNPAYILSKNSFIKSFEIFQDRFLNLGIKFYHIVLGSLGKDLIHHADVINYIYFLTSISNGCFPSQVILKSRAELT